MISPVPCLEVHTAPIGKHLQAATSGSAAALNSADLRRSTAEIKTLLAASHGVPTIIFSGMQCKPVVHCLGLRFRVEGFRALGLPLSRLVMVF